MPQKQRTVATKKVLHGKRYELWFLVYIYIIWLLCNLAQGTSVKDLCLLTLVSVGPNIDLDSQIKWGVTLCVQFGG